MEDEFQVLATDYESFSLEYKCDPNGILEKSGKFRSILYVLWKE